MINEKHSYRIQNAFDGHQDSFWYEIHSDGTELNSYCKARAQAKVYDGATIQRHIGMIRDYKNAKLVEV
jgi:LPS sulfotransferase NodH